MIKACFFDIDGTLYDHATQSIPDSTKKAISQLEENGIFCGIATGRHLLEIQEGNLLEDLHFDWQVTLNGQLCYDQDHLVHALPIAPEIIPTILTIAKEEQIALIMVEEDRMASVGYNRWLEAAQAAVHTSIPPKANYQLPYPTIYQISAFGPEDKLALFQSIEGLRVTHWHDGAVDLIPANGNKTAGIRQLLADHQLSMQEVIAFGDGANDLDMLEAAAIGVAMGNGDKTLKQHADYITAPIGQDGIAKALRHFTLIKERKDAYV